MLKILLKTGKETNMQVLASENTYTQKGRILKKRDGRAWLVLLVRDITYLNPQKALKILLDPQLWPLLDNRV